MRHSIARPGRRVDRLFATLPSLVAVEAAKADDKARRGGIFTREFMQSYHNPPHDLIDACRKTANSWRWSPTASSRTWSARWSKTPHSVKCRRQGNCRNLILESVQAYVGRVDRASLESFARPDRRPDLGPSLVQKSVPKSLRKSDRKLVRTFARNETRYGGEPRRPQRAPAVAALAREAIDTAARGQGADAARGRLAAAAH